jgi:hypothetical protein
MDVTQCLRFEHAKNNIKSYIYNLKHIEYFSICEINMTEFRLAGAAFPVTLLCYAVQIIRDMNKNITWGMSLSNITHGTGKNTEIYHDDIAWKLIANQDKLELQNFHYDYFKKLYEDILQLISNVQLKSIKINSFFGANQEELQEIVDRIKDVTKAEVICKVDWTT